MSRTALSLAVLALGLAAPASADDIHFEYLVVPEGATPAAAKPLEGFEKAANLQVRLRDSGYVYIVSSDASGQFRLAYPAKKPSAALTVADKLPPLRIVHLSASRPVQRLYLIVSKEPVAELNDLIGKAVPEVLPIEIRDQSRGDGTYTRETKENVVAVKYKPLAGRATVVEEISLRAPVPPTGVKTSAR